MDKRDLASQAEKYKQEMMRLYGKSTVRPTEAASVQQREAAVELPVRSSQETEVRMQERTEPETAPMQDNTVEESAPVQENQAVPEATEETREPQQTVESDINTEDNSRNEIELRYPEPDLSELTGNNEENLSNSRRQPYPEEILGTADGFIIINVRTGDDSEPVPGASVTITAIHDGKSYLLASGTTNNSGATEKFTVPVPDIKYSLTPENRIRPYSLYDISVKADGFFNARSVDVPVFDGITSVQNFSMIPLPLFMRSSDETIIYYNQEPNI